MSRIVRRGYHWSWLSNPPPLDTRIPLEGRPCPNLGLAVQELLQKQVIYKVHKQPCYLSTIFLVPKSSGGHRFIINLSKLNSFIEAPHFHMTNHHGLASMLQPPVWLASLDLQDAYFHVPIRRSLHKYLAFVYAGDLYFFKALPFGLNVAPYIFTRLMRYPLGLLHNQGVQVAAYLDDWVVWGKTKEETHQAYLLTANIVTKLGFLINVKKSNPEPTTDSEWLGVRWLSAQGRWGIPQEKQEKCLDVIRSLLQAKSCTRRKWENLLGMLAFIVQILSHYRHLLQPLLKPQLLGSHQNRDKPHTIPPQFKTGLLPWLEPGILQHTQQFGRTDTPVHLWTDASLTGWGGHTEGESTSGEWDSLERELHINVLEVRAVRLSILSLNLSDTIIHLFIDNTPAQFAIRKLTARAQSLLQEVKILVPILQSRNLILKAFRISTLLNARADDLSRHARPSMDWVMPQEIFDDLVAQRGHLEIDLMATADNTKLPAFLSPSPDPRSVGCNVLTWDWNQWTQIYIFPPKWFIPLIMMKIQTYHHHGLVILPRYPAEVWYSYILNRAHSYWELELPDPTRNGRPALERWTAFSF